jgi:hypothetical protein
LESGVNALLTFLMGFYPCEKVLRIVFKYQIQLAYDRYNPTTHPAYLLQFLFVY